MAAELHPVESCPGDADSWLKAGIRLKCPNDTLGRNLYQCAPNEDKTDLVEFCLKGSIGLYEEGLCLFAYPTGYIDAEECKTFVTGCPEKPYISNEIYNYPACLEINREAGCYVADPKCPSVDRTPVTLTVPYQDGLGNVTSTITNVTYPAHSNPQDSVNVAAAVASPLSIIVLIVFGIFLFIWCRRRVRRKRMQMYREELQESSMHMHGGTPSGTVLRGEQCFKAREAGVPVQSAYQDPGLNFMYFLAHRKTHRCQTVPTDLAIAFFTHQTCHISRVEDQWRFLRSHYLYRFRQKTERKDPRNKDNLYNSLNRVFTTCRFV